MMLVTTSFLQAQSPQAVTLQSLLRNASGRLIANQPLLVHVSIMQDSVTGSTVFSEKHTTSTNDMGLYTIQVGRGIAVLGNFSTIDWGNGPYYAIIENRPTGSDDYTIATSVHLVSVPYALFADTAQRVGQSV